MFRIHKLESFDLPELQPYRTMRRQLEQRQQGIFVAEGEKVVRRLLESDLRVVSALMPEKWARELAPLLQSRSDQVEVYIADKKLLETLTGLSMYQGLLAIGKVPEPVALESLLDHATQPYLLAAADNLSNAENMGALVRNCAGFGVQALVVGKTCCSPYLRRSVRNSMGTVFQLPVVETNELVQTLHWLRGRGIKCVAAHPHAEGKTLTQARLDGDCCVVLGSEGYGLSPAVLAACDEAAAIPMPPNIDSLNVGSAAAVFFFEANRQRGRM